MARAPRPCPTPGCPALLPPGVPRCPACARAHEAARGTRQHRGYGPAHDRARRAWAARLARGPVPCTRCGEPVGPGDAWHLDHADDRAGYLGPAHGACNTAAGGRAAHR